MPFIITEVGIPTSLGTSHSGYANRWHGHMTEAQQAAILIQLVDFMFQSGASARRVGRTLASSNGSGWRWCRRARVVDPVLGGSAIPAPLSRTPASGPPARNALTGRGRAGRPIGSPPRARTRHLQALLVCSSLSSSTSGSK